jgi:KaiC/GvpD/RAD55 family RecA-like ATPase
VAKVTKKADKKAGGNPATNNNLNGKSDSPAAGSQACPMCGELLGVNATKCESCGHEIKGGAVKKKKKKKTTKKAEAPVKKDIEKTETDAKSKSESKGPQNVEDEALAKWLSGEAGESALQVWLGKSAPVDTKAANQPSANAEEKDQALKMWLTGEAGGEALDEWLSEEQKAAQMLPGESAEKIAQKDELLKKTEAELKAKEEEIKDLRSELESFKKSLHDKLKKLKTKDFDPIKLISETAELNKELQGEIKKRKDLEAELQKVKQGSISVIKYVKSQQMKIKGSETKKLKVKLKKVAEEEKRLKEVLGKKEEKLKKLEKSLSKKIDNLPKEMKKLKKLEIELVEKETTISEKEQKLESYAGDLREREAVVSSGAAGSDDELRSRFEGELQQKQTDYLKMENDLKKRIIELEEEVQKAKIDEKLEKEALQRRGMSESEISKELEEKEKLLANREKSMNLRENENERLRQELKYKEDELKKLKEPLAYKEDEILRREEDLLYREKLIVADKRKLEQAKKEGGGLKEMELKKRLEELQAKVNEKEDDIRKKEKYLNAKSEELRIREQGLIEEEIESREEERALEFSVEKVKTGNPRLDDLLFGGIPFGSNVLVYGQAFIGKEVVISQFVAEGLKKGIPAIWVITDKTPADIREEMEFVVSGYQEYEKLDLVRYVDAYSKSMGEEAEDPYTTYINEPTDHEGLLKSVDTITKELKKKHKYYRLAFRSISTLIAYLDTNIAFRFLQPFAGRRKRDKGVAMYIIEKGMHSETDIQMLGSIMDGAVEFKLEQLQTFLCIKGIGDVQSRAWIRYTHSKKGVNIGSFALGHIR